MENGCVDWAGLAERCGSLTEKGETGGYHLGLRAIAALLGDQALIEATNYSVGYGRGSELARSVLHVLRPPVGMKRCLDIYASDQPLEVRRAAVDLLGCIGDQSMLPFVRQFLDDPDEDIQNWGVNLLDQLLFGRFVTLTEAEEYLRLGEAHGNERVRQTVQRLRRSSS
jgi:HEAT repeat protein